MQTFLLFLVGLLQAVLLFLLAPLITGMARVLRAKFHSRQGPGLFQDYRDLKKLLGRREIVAQEAGAVFAATPYIFLMAMLLVAMAIPAIFVGSPIGAMGDLIAVLYLLALGRFFFTLSGIDSGSVFGGIGASRETTLAVVNEPIMMLSLFIVAILSGSTNLGVMSDVILHHRSVSYAAIGLAALAFGFAIFIEMGKLPFDLAEAEQELQEGPLTEYSGSSLALMKWGVALRQVVAAALFVGLFLPFGAATSLSPLALILGALILSVKLIVIFAALSFLENTMARVRFLDSTRLTFVAASAAVLGFAFSLAGI